MAKFLFQIGHKVSKITRLKISRALKGKKLDPVKRQIKLERLRKEGKRIGNYCEYCGLYFERAKSLLLKHIFCSKQCCALWMKYIRKTKDHPLYRGIGNKNAKLYRQRSKKNNPNYYQSRRENNVIYRIRRRGLGGNINREEWKNIKKAPNYSCKICGKKEPEIKLVADHIIPVTRWKYWIKNKDIKYKCGDKENIQALCVSCNCKKSNKLL